jgi:diguanylate cyclase (GGDEF)-like protein/PAS domain S-box-containing protein
VLLIDDDSFAFEIVSLLIAEIASPIVLKWAGSFEAGLEELLKGGFDVCLLDYQLGEHSGLDLLRAASARGCRTPIVMLTARTDRELDVEAMKAGAVDFLIKGEFGGAFLERVVRYAAERARTLDRLRESEERYELAVSGANDVIWDWKVGDPEVFLSPRFREVLGHSPGMGGESLKGWLAQVHPDDQKRLSEELESTVSNSTAKLQTEVRFPHRDGSWRWLRLRASATRDPHGRATRIAGSLSDVTTARNRDPLTGLANRVLYLDRLDHALERIRRDTDYTFAVLFLDCDRFKVINDSLGHTAGDALLIGIAQRLERCTRAIDTVARFGGDEFAILLDDAREPDGPTRVAERIITALSHPFEVNGRQVFTGASVGIAMYRKGYGQGGELLRDADIAMYRAKAQGGGRMAVFDEQMHARAMAMLQLESELRQAVAGNQLEVHYQPLVTTSTGQLKGFEALVRWRHPVRGLVAPNDFVPLAEETGVIVAIDRWVLEESCSQAAKWPVLPTGSRPTISVNASRRQLDRAGSAQIILDVLAKTGLPAAQLCLEVTETVVMDHPQVVANLTALRQRGVQIVMDDFGTGYSSLAGLHSLPFTGMKIDRTFIMQLTTSSKAREVVRAIITLGFGLDLEVVAEGVETREQRGVLEELGCPLLQGYLFSRPVPLAEAMGWFSRKD